MGWALGYDARWNRWIGYGVPATCDHPGCGARIDRGLAYVCCAQEPYGGDGCGLYFCGEHSGPIGRCERCDAGEEPFDPTPDVPEWVDHILTDPSWQQWRDENSDEAQRMRANQDSREG